MIDPRYIRTISDLRFKTKDVLKDSEKTPVYVFQHSEVKGVLLSYTQYAEMVEKLEDYYLSLRAQDYEREKKRIDDWASHKEVKKRLLDRK